MRGAAIAIVVGAFACSFEVRPSSTAPGDGRSDSSNLIDAPIDLPLDVSMVDACGGCPVNDVPGGALMITGSGAVSGNMTNAHDDIAVSCGKPGGRDLFYELVVPTDQLVYVDTEGSSFDAAMALFPGSCTTSQPEMLCSSDACPPDNLAQIARSLAAGTYCLVVDEGSASTGDTLVLDVTFLGDPGMLLTGTLPYQVSGNTCGSPDHTDPTCENLATSPGTAEDNMYFFPICANAGAKTVTASTCNAVGYDSIVSIRGRAGPGSCTDDGCAGGPNDGSLATTHFTAGTGVVRVIVDGWNGECGTYNLSVSVTP